MKRVFSILIAVMLVVSCLALAACGGESQKKYSNKPNDGHMHSYIHNVQSDKYICALCGVEYKGDPSNLVRVD